MSGKRMQGLVVEICAQSKVIFGEMRRTSIRTFSNRFMKKWTLGRYDVSLFQYQITLIDLLVAAFTWGGLR